MNIIRHRALRLIGICAIAIAVPQLASAMGPTSAPLKNQQNVRVTSDNTVTPATKCIPSEGTCPKLHHRSKH
jgi:hypothetical protein